MRIYFFVGVLFASCAVSPADAQSFTRLGFLPGGSSPSEAYDVSADGTVVVGISRDPVFGGSYQAFRWTAAGGMVGLNKRASTWGSQATISGDGSMIMLMPYIWKSSAVETPTWSTINSSYDGSIIVGTRGTGFEYPQSQATRWSQATGFIDLGFLPSDDPVFLATSVALDVSADGNVIVGYSTGRDGAFPEAFRWTPQTGMTGLGFRGTDIHVSADGSMIAATSQEGELVLWTEAGGTQSLGKTGTPYGISGDGGRIVGLITEPVGDGGGGSISYPFIWEAAYGFRHVNDVLMNDYGLGAAMAGWWISEVHGISDDGRTLVGEASGPNGFSYQAWAATIPPSSVPEPSAAAIVLIGCVWFATRSGQRRKNACR